MGTEIDYIMTIEINDESVRLAKQAEEQEKNFHLCLKHLICPKCSKTLNRSIKHSISFLTCGECGFNYRYRVETSS